MSQTTSGLFDKTVQKTREWLKEVRAELRLESDQDAYAALRAVLHALRDRLTIEEAAELGSQLPMLVRGFYYEGWDPSNKPLKIRSAEEFLQGVERSLVFRRNNKDVIFITTGILRILENRITRGEIKDIKAALPHDILTLWPQAARSESRPSGQGVYDI